MVRQPQISIHALREERDTVMVVPPEILEDFNPRAPRGARRPARKHPANGTPISIHALREERDSRRSASPCSAARISIHALREERDNPVVFPCTSFHTFQSTRSARSATRGKNNLDGAVSHFNPRAPRGARRVSFFFWPMSNRFQSTRSARSATIIETGTSPTKSISIHALREERDLFSLPNFRY